MYILDNYYTLYTKASSKVFSVSFSFCFLGKPSFVSESMTGLVDLILNEDPPPLRQKGLTPHL